MLIKQRRGTGVNSCLDHIRSSVPVHVFSTMEPSRKRTGCGSILAYFNKRSRPETETGM